MKPRDECMYYLVRESFNADMSRRREMPVKMEKDVYFNDVLEHVRTGGLTGLAKVEIDCLIEAARRRNRLPELDAAIKAGGD